MCSLLHLFIHCKSYKLITHSLSKFSGQKKVPYTIWNILFFDIYYGRAYKAAQKENNKGKKKKKSQKKASKKAHKKSFLTVIKKNVERYGKVLVCIYIWRRRRGEFIYVRIRGTSLTHIIIWMEFLIKCVVKKVDENMKY